MQLGQKIVVSVVYVTAMFMVALDGTVVNVALPSIGHEFQVPPSATGTVNIGYLISLAIFLPVAGWLGDRWGTRRILLSALGVFAGASALCGFADSLLTLNAFRVIQGAGGGMIAPVGMAMLFRTFPPEERPKLSRSLVFPVAVAPALGPVIGGLLVEHLSWRWVFYVNLPIGILAILFGSMFLAEHKEPAAGRFDFPGFLFSASGFSMLIYSLTQGSLIGWNSAEVLVTGIVGLMLIAALVITELRAEKPMLDLRLLSDPLFRTMNLISFFSTVGLLGMLFVFPLMYQNALNESALDTGLTLFPEALGLMLASQVMPWSYKKVGVRRLIMIALLCTIAIFVVLTLVIHKANPWLLRVLFFGVGFFLGQSVGAVQFTSFANIDSSSMGRATTLFNVQNRFASAMGVAILAGLLSVFGTVTGNGQPDLAAYQAALFGAVVCLLTALFFATRIQKSDVTSTMRNQSVSPARSPETGSIAKAGE
ncbi:MAG: MDR family MFS transporter [Thermoactinomyces sp.]